MWIHKNKNWPNFTWDEKRILSKLLKIKYSQGKLLGKMEEVGFDLRSEASLNILTSNIVKSSIIEGEKLNTSEVRSSIGRRLKIPVKGAISSSHYIDGIVEVMLDATQNFNSLLTKDRLFDWHSALFPTGRSGMNKIEVGNWRNSDSGPMEVVSGKFGEETVHFQAPHANRLEKEMSLFLEWIENEKEIDFILKSGIAHFWFVTIHPFEDGNGRIARTISDMLLTRSDNIKNRFYSLSTQIEAERQEYYSMLEKQQSGSLDITPWLDWYLNCVEKAILSSEEILKFVLLKSRVWNKLSKCIINERQRLIINRMLESDFKGNMNTSKYGKIAKCSADTALRDIKKLEEQEVLIKSSSGGRSTSYLLSTSL